MMRSSVILLCFLIFSCESQSTDTTTKEEESLTDIIDISYVIGDPGYYSYAPSAIESDSGDKYIFVCHNKTKHEVIDYIYFYKSQNVEQENNWSSGKAVLGPSNDSWDSIHTCDPDVRRLDYSYKGDDYKWIMFYLGNDTEGSKHNQIGLAFSKEIDGPYIKYDDNPLIGYEDTTTWGVGQSTAVVLDDETVNLYYSKWPDNQVKRQIQFNESSSIKVGDEEIISHLDNNTYVSYFHDEIFTVKSYKSYDFNEMPDMVGDVIRVQNSKMISGGYRSSGEWNKIVELGPGITGFDRNHNPGFLTDEKGYLRSRDELIVYFTVSQPGNNWLWTYDLYSAKIELENK